MGVHGLTTYLREKKRLLSKSIVLSSSSNTSIPIVVDGWSFIYDLHNTSNLPWVYGGEYAEFTRLVTTVVRAWIKIGLQVSFVFDGACPDLKFPTVISRLGQSHIQPAQLFFRTSAVSRSTGRFLNENRILPPLAYSACLHALEALRSEVDGLEIHFADEEGDPYAVELAGRLGGYVVGNDSDFVILNSDGYLGYIPMGEMVWQVPVPEETSSINADDGDFQTVRKPKAKRKDVNGPKKSLANFVPPENYIELPLSLTTYSPETLAKHLNIPVSLLPLLGALVGNDFSKESESNSRKIQALFFDRQLTLIQRIERVANTLHSVITPGAQRRKAKHQVGSVMDLIDRTVNALLARLVTTMGSGEVEDIVDKIVNATLQYAIPKHGGIAGREGLWATSVCALHDPEVCSLLPIISRKVMQQAEESAHPDPALLEAREQYLDAYRSGLLSPKIMDILSTGSSWGRLFLENPDLETVGRSIGRPVREWIFAILDDTVGLPPVELDDADSSAARGDSVDESDDDELIDVAESDDEGSEDSTDFLAPLKGELHRLHSSEGDATEPPTSITSHRRRPLGLPTVTEYLRRGTRIASEIVLVKSITDLLSSIQLPEYGTDDAPPLSLRSEDDRWTVFLRILGSDLPSVRQLPSETVLAVLAVRWVINILHVRWQETNSKEREKERWTRNEARCFLASFTWGSCEESATANVSSDPPPVLDRNIQLMAQVLMALDTIEQLSQVLLLTRRVPFNAHQLSGKLFHALLTATSYSTKPLPSGIWDATETGLNDVFQEERVKKSKKPKAEKAVTPTRGKGLKKDLPSKGLFDLLGDMDDL